MTVTVPKKRYWSRTKGVDGLTTLQRAIIDNYTQTGSVARALKILGVNKLHIKNHHLDLARNEAYAAAFKEAQASTLSIIEAEMFRRAVQGATQPVFYEGRVCGHTREYSDKLLLALARKFDRASYGESTGDINIGIGAVLSTGASASESITRLRAFVDSVKRNVLPGSGGNSAEGVGESGGDLQTRPALSAPGAGVKRVLSQTVQPGGEVPRQEVPDDRGGGGEPGRQEHPGGGDVLELVFERRGDQRDDGVGDRPYVQEIG